MTSNKTQLFTDQPLALAEYWSINYTQLRMNRCSVMRKVANEISTIGVQHTKLAYIGQFLEPPSSSNALTQLHANCRENKGPLKSDPAEGDVTRNNSSRT